MKLVKNFLGGISFITVLCILSSGCAAFKKQTPGSQKQVEELQQRVSDLERLRDEENAKFTAVKEELERRLADQIAKDQVSLKMGEAGLVIILSDEILFDSGKAEIKPEAAPVLDKVADIIVKEVPDKNIGISGHSDNVPITYSAWKSNWELSAARAMTVLHYMEGKGVVPARLSATGYGEFRPVAANDTPENQAKNRRVEIVILPAYSEKKLKREPVLR
jgi:chemotaxis protein MotB